jgi:hypothetical protein
MMLEAIVKRQNNHDISETPTDGRSLSGAVELPISTISSDATPSLYLASTLDATLSQTLYSLLPSSEESEQICGLAGLVPCFFQQMLTRNFMELSASDCSVLTRARVAMLPPPNSHPAVIVQKMFMLACITQYHSKQGESINTKLVD